MNSEQIKRYTRQIAAAVTIAGVLWLLAGSFRDFSLKPGLVLLIIAFPFWVMGTSVLRSYAFTAWVFACASIAMLYPQVFIQWGEFRLALLIIPLTQIIMFGMGTTLSIQDFVRVTKSPWPVFLGMFLQFGVMPLSGFLLAVSFGFEGELAAGIVLIGSCSGGVASNLMVYLARGNVALSVTMTFASTLLAPLATPLLMSNLAGTFVPIDALQMMFSILNMIIVPVVAGLIAHEILYSDRKWAQQGVTLILLTVGSLTFASATFFLGTDVFGPLYSGLAMGGVLIAGISFTKYVMSIILKRPNTWMDTMLPLIAKTAICMVIAIIIAQTRNVLLDVGVILLLAAILHNTIGYSLGYYGSKGFGVLLGSVGYQLGFTRTSESLISETESRTIAFEVGMQNGGMASGLAVDVLQSTVAALPPNIFGTWMNISGSMLANYWIQKTPEKMELNTDTEQVPVTS